VSAMLRRTYNSVTKCVPKPRTGFPNPFCRSGLQMAELMFLRLQPVPFGHSGTHPGHCRPVDGVSMVCRRWILHYPAGQQASISGRSGGWPGATRCSPFDGDVLGDCPEADPPSRLRTETLFQNDPVRAGRPHKSHRRDAGATTRNARSVCQAR